MIYLRKSWERLCDEYASRGSFGARVKGKNTSGVRNTGPSGERCSSRET